MSLRINDVAPDFTADTTEGTISFHQWIGDGWAILFSHPKDFTPVCTTELGTVAGLKAEFERRNCKVLGISVDGVSDHERVVAGHRGVAGPRVELPARGRPGAEGREGLRHAAGRRRRHVGGAHAGRQRDGALGVRHRPRQAHQGDPDLPDEHGAQLRRDPAAARLVPAHGDEEGGDARQLGARARTSSSCPRYPTTRPARSTPTAGRRPCPTCASSRSRSRPGGGGPPPPSQCPRP